MCSCFFHATYSLWRWRSVYPLRIASPPPLMAMGGLIQQLTGWQENQPVCSIHAMMCMLDCEGASKLFHHFCTRVRFVRPALHLPPDSAVKLLLIFSHPALLRWREYFTSHLGLSRKVKEAFTILTPPTYKEHTHTVTLAREW